MQFTKSKYYNKEFLGENLYDSIVNSHKILTAQECFEINNVEKEYFKSGLNLYGEYYNYKLTIQNKYYELDCQEYDSFLYLVFDKPVHITGKYCNNIIAPEIIVKNSEGNTVSYCVVDKLVINNNEENYGIKISKINNVYFYNEKIYLNKSEINNLFIFNPDLRFSVVSIFLNYYKIKCFGHCKNLKERFLEYKKFKERIIHIE